MIRSSFKNWMRTAVVLALVSAVMGTVRPVHAIQTSAYIYEDPSNSTSYANWLKQPNVWAETFQYASWWSNLESADRLTTYPSSTSGNWVGWLQANSNRRLIYTVGMLAGNVTYSGSTPTYNAPGDGTATFADGASNKYDTHWATFATNVKNTGVASQIIFRIGHEMNGNWYMWYAGRDTSSGHGDYISYWKNIVNKIRSVIPNAQFIWCPNYGAQSAAPDQYFPSGNDGGGKPYVNYIGLDVYDTDTSSNIVSNNPYSLGWWANWRNSHAAGIPLCLPEWGLQDTGHGGNGDDTTFIQTMYNWMVAGATNCAFENYYDVNASDGGHAIWIGPDGTWSTVFPNSRALYVTLFSGGASGPPIGHKITLWSAPAGRYMQANLNDPNKTVGAYGTAEGWWETFTVVDAGGGNIALYNTTGGRYVQANLNDANHTLMDIGTSVGWWETFGWKDLGSGNIALWSPYANYLNGASNGGFYVSADLNRGNNMEALWATTVQNWEIFKWRDLGP